MFIIMAGRIIDSIYFSIRFPPCQILPVHPDHEMKRNTVQVWVSPSAWNSVADLIF